MKNKLIILVFLIFILVSCVPLLSFAFAEEKPFSVPAFINFNQKIDFSKVPFEHEGLKIDNISVGKYHIYGAYTKSKYFPIFSLDLDISKYFIEFSCSNSNISLYAWSNSNSTISGDFIYSPIKSLGFVLEQGQSYDFIFSVNLFDLTQMFGAGNEPTSETELFSVLPNNTFFPFNNGQLISSSGVDAFQQGVNSVLQGQTVFEYPYQSIDNFMSYDLGNKTEIALDSATKSIGFSFDYNDTNPTNVYSFALNLPYAFVAGSKINLHFDELYFALSSDTTISSFYLAVPASHGYSVLYDFKLSQYKPDKNVGSMFWAYQLSLSQYDISVVLPKNTDTLLFVAVADTSNFFNVVYVNNMRYDYVMRDIDKFQQNSYNSGFEAGKGAGFNIGYNSGYNKGLSDSKSYTFSNLINSVISAPINMLVGEYDSNVGERVGGLLNFEFLGVNLSSFFTALLSIAIILCILRILISVKGS